MNDTPVAVGTGGAGGLDDVANAVAFLASDRAGNITGEVIHVCAGSQMPPTP